MPTKEPYLDSSWKEIGTNPNNGQVLATRAEIVRCARGAPVSNRFAYIENLAQGRYVLDVGVVDHDGTSRSPQLLHKRITEVATTCTGIDVEEEAVLELYNAGYNIKVCDATSHNDIQKLQHTFDLIICGEIIEHLGSPLSLLKNLKEVLAPGGTLLITSPNVLSVFIFARFFFKRWRDSADHVIYVTPHSMVELANRTGMQLRRWRGALMESSTLKHQLALHSGKLLSPVIQREVWCNTIIYELEHSKI